MTATGHARAKQAAPRGPHGRLPTDPRTFRAAVSAAKSETDRAELLERIEKESGAHPKGPKLRLLESRLIEFVRTPQLSRESWTVLATSHDNTWRTLIRLRSRAFAPLLRAWMQGRNTKLAREAAMHLAWDARDQDLPRLEKAVRSAPWPLPGAIASGAGLAAYHGHASTKFRSRMFAAIADIARGHISAPVTDAGEDALEYIAEALLRLDSKAALKLLTGPGVIRPGNRCIRQILLALHFDREERPGLYRKPIDPALLWPVYDSLRSRTTKLPTGNGDYRFDQASGLVLEFAADGDPLRTTRECRAILADKRIGKDSSIRGSAQAAMKRCRKLPEPDAALRSFQKRPASVGPKAAQVLRAYEMWLHVQTDGLGVYFANHGEHWRSARDGMRILGLTSAASVLADGAGVFTRSGSLSDFSSSMAAYESLDARGHKTLQSLEDRFERAAADTVDCVERFIAAHAAEFTRTR